jgi:predicted nucleic acid-binding protein
MHSIVISDTSCLIILNKIGQLEILQKVYYNVITTPEVAIEFLEKLPDWVIIKEVQDKKYQEFLET